MNNKRIRVVYIDNLNNYFFVFVDIFQRFLILMFRDRVYKVMFVIVSDNILRVLVVCFFIDSL